MGGDGVSKTVCCFCRRARVETVCGDQSCPCCGGPAHSDLRPAGVGAIEGVGFTLKDGREVTQTRCSCGRWVLVEVKRRKATA
jgi:hypothetical protein